MSPTIASMSILSEKGGGGTRQPEDQQETIKEIKEMFNESKVSVPRCGRTFVSFSLPKCSDPLPTLPERRPCDLEIFYEGAFPKQAQHAAVLWKLSNLEQLMGKAK